MLIEFTVGNYRSFREPQTLSMVATTLKSRDPALDENTVIQLSGNPDLLTGAAVYGANASGKSNLIQALDFMRWFVQNSFSTTKATDRINVEPFRLYRAAIDKPSYFEIVFIADGIRYRYGFEVTREKVIAEWLYFVPSVREARLFAREDDNISLGHYFKEGRDLEQYTRPNALFLSVVAQFNGSQALKVVSWFERLGIGSEGTRVSMEFFTSRQLADEGEYSAAIRQLIVRLDLGISDLYIERSSSIPPDFSDGLSEDVQQVFQKLLDTAGVESFLTHTVHTQYDEEGNAVGQELFNLKKHESAGTQRLFALSGPLLQTLHEGRVLVVDELDARLHPLMTREIIALFNNKATNPHGAQLIFNTQDSNLLDNTLFRRDQIWFVEKDQQGASHLYSLAEFKVRNDKDYERGYMQGRYGAVPYLRYVHEAVSEKYGEKA